MRKRLLPVVPALALCVAALAQNPYPGNALPTAPWIGDGSGTRTVVPIDTGNGLQLVDAGGSATYNQFYAEHTMPVLTMESRFRVNSTNGNPHILQLTVPGASSPNRAPSLVVAINAGQFQLQSLDHGHTYATIGPIDAGFHVAQLGIDKTNAKVYASWDGAMILNGVPVTYFDIPFSPAYVEFGAGTFDHATGNTTATFDYVNYNSGITVTPEPGTVGLLGLASLLIARGRRIA